MQLLPARRVAKCAQAVMRKLSVGVALPPPLLEATRLHLERYSDAFKRTHHTAASGAYNVPCSNKAAESAVASMEARLANVAHSDA